jgi:hypothetical protein
MTIFKLERNIYSINLQNYGCRKLQSDNWLCIMIRTDFRVYEAEAARSVMNWSEWQLKTGLL